MDRRFGVPDNPTVSPDEVRIRSFDVEPYPAVLRLKRGLNLMPFHTSHDTKAEIEDHEDHEVSSSNIIGLVSSKVIFTVHIREPDPAGHFTTRVSWSYPDEGLVDRKEANFMTPHASVIEGE